MRLATASADLIRDRKKNRIKRAGHSVQGLFFFDNLFILKDNGEV